MLVPFLEKSLRDRKRGHEELLLNTINPITNLSFHPETVLVSGGGAAA